MNQRATRLLLGIAMAVMLPRAAAAQSLLFDYLGFDYEYPDPIPAQHGEALQ